MATIEEVKAGLAQAGDETARAITGIRGVVDGFDRAITILRAVSVGSGALKVAQAISQLEQAKSRLAEAAQLGNASISTARDYTAML